MRKTLTRAVLGLGVAGLVAVPVAAQAAPAVHAKPAAPATGNTNCANHVYYYIQNNRPGQANGNGPTNYTLAANGHGDGFCTKTGSVSGYVWLVNASDTGQCATFQNYDGLTVDDQICGRFPASQDWGAINGSGDQVELINYYANGLGDNPCLVGNAVGSNLGFGPCLPNGSASELWTFTQDADAVTTAKVTTDSVSAVAGPLVTYKWKNTDSNGCAKDEGKGNNYELAANCSVASNFTRSDCGTRSGTYYCEYTDGSGYALTVSGIAVVAGTPVGADTQLFSDPSSSHKVVNYYEVENSFSAWMASGGNGADIYMYVTGSGGSDWELS